MAIVHDDDVLGGEPRIEGTRIGVRHVASKVLGGGNPAYVADQLDLPLATVYEALSYYYEHTDEIAAFERENREAADRIREGSLEPKEPVQ